MTISILFQIIIIWYCGKAWCVKYIPWWRIICPDMILFCFLPQVMLKPYLSFLFINITAPENRIKNYPFTRVSINAISQKNPTVFTLNDVRQLIYFVSYTARHPRQTKNGQLLFIFRNIKETATPPI